VRIAAPAPAGSDETPGPLAVGRTAPGRGAWVCSAACLDDALRRGRLARALRRPVTSAEAQRLRARLDNTKNS
jgi:predicted RNA-binding protein YlxR (DUF448 family)